MKQLLTIAIASSIALTLVACAVPHAYEATPSASTPTSTQWAKANGVHLRYELAGSGAQTVVLLHEMSVSMESWDYVMPELARDYRVLRYDLRGFGLSERISGVMSMDDEMGDLRGLLETLNIKGQVTLIGGAIGGAIALKYAATYPEQVRAVVAISPAAYLKARPVGGAGSPPAQTSPSPVGDTSAFDAVFPVKLQTAHPDRFARFLAIQSAVVSASSAATTPAAYSINYSEVLPNIKCPSMIVATSLWMRPPDSFKELADAIPGARFEVLETGHFAPMESPELVLPLLKSFLKDTGRPRS
jgi:3-oxoadipate enol-lactonase